MKKLILILGLALPLASCTSNKEDDDLAKAQSCLNQVSQAHPEEADDCLQYVDKYDSQKADILKCSIHMTSGGLVENKIVKAAQALQSSSGLSNKDSVYMSVLCLDNSDVNVGYTKALLADKYCQSSGVPGLQYISSIIVAGSLMAKTMDALHVLPSDLTDTSAMQTAATQLLSACTSNPPDASCTANISVLGEAAAKLAEGYCSTSKASTDVCSNVDKAMAAAGGDSSKVGQAVYCFMNHQTFDLSLNSGAGGCN